MQFSAVAADHKVFIDSRHAISQYTLRDGLEVDRWRSVVEIVPETYVGYSPEVIEEFVMVLDIFRVGWRSKRWNHDSWFRQSFATIGIVILRPMRCFILDDLV